ncbi:hypothetical protein [Lactococcus lactis]|uniref:hypothetical protein n=1 Tax=Lactococcus lactis TaxID=1358 RepID=UPI002FE4F057
MKVINCAKCNEEYAIDLNKPEEWYCPYCDNLYSIATDKLSVEKLQERCDRYEKALTEIYNLHYCLNPTEKGKCGLIAHDALAAIGGDDE